MLYGVADSCPPVVFIALGDSTPPFHSSCKFAILPTSKQNTHSSKWPSILLGSLDAIIIPIRSRVPSHMPLD